MRTSTVLEGVAVALSLSLASPAMAAVVNVDIERPGDATHSGADGAASAGGSVWNSVLFDTDRDLLQDETGLGTTVAVRHLSSFFGPPSAFVDGAAANDLQDSGVSGAGMDILNLLPGSTYSLAIYGAPGSNFTVIDGAGLNGGACTGSAATYALPGVQGEDYCLYTGLVPIEVDPGVYGIQLSGPLVVLTGFQLVGDVEYVETPDTNPPVCSTSEPSTDPGHVMAEIEDTDSGLSEIRVVASENVSVSISPFDPGTVNPVTVEVVRMESSMDGFVEIEGQDVAGNTGTCRFEVFAVEPPPPPPPSGCSDVVDFFNESVSAGAIEGMGPGSSALHRLNAFRNILHGICDLLDEGSQEEACQLIQGALKKCDGDTKQPDFVSGESVPDLFFMIQDLQEASGCNERAIQSRLSRKSQTALPTVPITWGRVKSLYPSGS